MRHYILHDNSAHNAVTHIVLLFVKYISRKSALVVKGEQKAVGSLFSIRGVLVPTTRWLHTFGVFQPTTAVGLQKWLFQCRGTTLWFELMCWIATVMQVNCGCTALHKASMDESDWSSSGWLCLPKRPSYVSYSLHKNLMLLVDGILLS